MKYTITFTSDAVKNLRKLDQNTQKILLVWIKKNLEGTSNPFIHGKSLQYDYAGAWRYRVGKYRILSHVKRDVIEIEIFKIGLRKNIYKK
jgi:mRNA interferase RelE/StbE